MQLIKEKLICIGGFFSAWQEICKAFPSDPSERDNSWVSQPLFNNSNVKTKIPTNNAAGYKLLPLDSRYFGFPSGLHKVRYPGNGVTSQTQIGSQFLTGPLGQTAKLNSQSASLSSARSLTSARQHKNSKPA